MNGESISGANGVRVLPERPRGHALRNLLRYTAVRGSILIVTVVTAVYLTIIIANYGGYVDEMVGARIDLAVADMTLTGWPGDVSLEEREAIILQTKEAMREDAGLNQPFLLRTFRWLGDGLTLNWGTVERSFAYNTSSRTTARQLIVDNLSRTLLVFGSANLLLFVTTVFLALLLTRRHGGRLDRLFVLLSPLSAAPAWVYGILLSVFLLRVFTFSPGGTFDTWPADAKLSYLPILLRNLFPPLLAIFISGLFQGAYSWRTFFLIYASEDYVDLAKAKGLKNSLIDRRYILRPALPALLTSFALLVIGLWQEVIALEYFFNVAGIGRVFLAALRAQDTPVIVSLVVTFAYLLAITVFILDLTYAFVDPRVRVGNQTPTVQATTTRRKSNLRAWFRDLVRKQRRAKKRLPVAVSAQPAKQRTGSSLHPGSGRRLTRVSKNLWRFLQQLSRFPSAIFGLAIIAVLIGIAIYTIWAVPYDDAVALWRNEGNVWAHYPRNALPAWVNAFRVNDLPETIVLESGTPEVEKEIVALSAQTTEINFTFPIDYPYGGFPQELVLSFDNQFDEKLPNIDLKWLTPDQREIDIANFSAPAAEVYYVSRDERLQRRFDTPFPQEALFFDPAAAEELALQGRYELQVSALVFEENADVDAELVLFGQVYGIAGTDEQRRDLLLPLLWGTVIALGFGLIAAVATSLLGVIFAAMGAWYGGWVDRLVQFMTETNMILPFFPVCLMIFVLYSRSIWVILGTVVLLSVFGTSLKTYRATFLQLKETPYVEAALAYGASNRRIIFHYLLPRILGVLLSKLVILVPSYVFLEATLAFLGVSDPVLPTWGKLVVAALTSAVYRNAYHMVLAPLALLFITGFGFALLGLALERIFEPRLQEI